MGQTQQGDEMNVQQLREIEDGREPTAFEVFECALFAGIIGIGIFVLLALPVVRIMQEMK